MKSLLYWTGLLLAVAFLALTVVNASWLAPSPRGSPKLIAHRGVAQIYDATGVGRDTCTATRIEAPVHDYVENTLPGMRATLLVGTQMVEVDIVPTRDGELALFHDWTLDCRTDGSGAARSATLAQLQALDAGFGYTADGGESFPLRGNPENRIPTLEEGLRALPRKPILFNFKSADPAEADLLAERLIASGRRVERLGDGFYGHLAPVTRIREHFPDAWAWSTAEARACSEDYVLYGWTGYLPQSCRSGTMVVPLNYQWAFWGWPNRTIARMEAHGGRILMTGPHGDDAPNQGLLLPEQLGDIPSSYNGYVWVEDIWTIGPALRPSQDRRRPEMRKAADEALEARRARLEAQ